MSMQEFLNGWAANAGKDKFRRQYLELGEHELEIVAMAESKPAPDQSKYFETLFLVCESNSMRPGQTAQFSVRTQGPARFLGQDVGKQARIDMFEFFNGLVGATKTEEAVAAGMQILSPEGMASQIVKGMRVRCTVTQAIGKRDGQPKFHKDGGPVRNYRWRYVEQTPEQIAARRAEQEASPAPAEEQAKPVQTPALPGVGGQATTLTPPAAPSILGSLKLPGQ